MEAVARAAGIAKPTLYAYFPDKTAVFMALVSRSAWIRRVLASRYGVVRVAAVYGPFIWLVMSLAVISLATGKLPAFGLRWWVQVFAHVPFVALGNYLTLAGYDRAIIVTDAIAPAGLGPGRYTLGRWDIVVDTDMVPRSPDRSHFVGSAVTMQQSVKNLRRALNVPPDALRRLTSENPGRVIGL